MAIKPHFRKNEEETGVVEVGEEGNKVQIDAASTEIVFIDPEKDIQVVMSDDPNNKDGVVCAVMTASAENVEDNQLLGSATAEPESAPAGGEGGEGGEGGDGGAAEEARKAEARKRFRERFSARNEARKAEARIKARDEARAKFRAHAKPTGSK